MKFTKNYSITNREAMYYTNGWYIIEKVHQNSTKGYGWYVTNDQHSWDGGYFNSLTDAKNACVKHQEEIHTFTHN